MRVLVYAPRSEMDRALARVDALRAERYSASWVDARAYAGEVERCERVVTDLDAVREAYEAAGVEVEPLTVLSEAPADVPAPEPARRGRRKA